MTRALLLLVLAGCTSVDIDPMEQQPKDKAYRSDPFWDDQRAMRVPPEGTVPRERPMLADVVESGRMGEAPVDRIPLPVTPELLAAGQRRFDIVCAACHGILGDGQSLVARNMSLRPPPSLYLFVETLPPGRLFQIISEGYGMMPAYNEEIPIQERWAVVAYLQALTLSQRARPQDLPPEVRSELEKIP